MPYKKELGHIPENELLGVGVIGSWVLDNAYIDSDHREYWENMARKFQHPATREAALFFLHGTSMSNPEAKKIVEQVKRWHGDKHAHVNDLRQKHKNKIGREII